MPLSSNSLIHFTDQKDALKGILEDNFKIFNCMETLKVGSVEIPYIVPMVSFCDIPLSEIKNHIERYGNYGIGMTKDWANRQGLNPVLYMAQTSMLSESYVKAWNSLVDSVIDINQLTHEQNGLADVLRYTKNYEADLKRKNTLEEKYRFSDEREWRYVPPFTTDCIPMAGIDWYMTEDNKYNTDSKLVDLRLDFNPEDIKYIIIADDSEISEFIDHLRRAKGKKYSLNEIERLTTRILTVEQIKSDI